MKQLNLWPCAFLIALLLFGVPVTAQQKLNSSQTNRTERNAKTTVSTEEETVKTTDISPLEAFKSKKEVVSKRDAYSKHYQNEDGSYTALIGAGPIHYEKNGQFEDIDHSITRSGNPAFPYANTTNLFESYFGETSHTGVKNKTAEGELIEFLNTKMYWEVNGRPVNERASANVSVTIDGDKAYYNNLYGNIFAEFITLTGKRKLNYIIPTRQEISNAPQNAEYLVFTEDVVLPEGWTSKETENGILIKNAAGKEIYLYENPASTDAANALDREKNTVFETVLNGNILTIVTKVKTAWLLSNDRQFPVMVDPTVNVYPNNSTNWTRTVRNNGVGLSSLYFGRESSTFLRGFMRFNTDGIPLGSSVTAVRGWIGIINYSYWDREWQFASSIDPVNNSGINLYNSASIIYSTASPVSSPGGWINNVFNTDGINNVNINYSNGSVYVSVRTVGNYANPDYYEIANHTTPNPPYLAIDYTEGITDRTLTVSGAHTGGNPGDGSHTYAHNTQVTATSGTREGYIVTGWTGTGSVSATGTSGSATFTISQNSSITWQWQQTGIPDDVVFHNYGGTEQLAFNNSRVATTTPTFRLSHSAYSANAYEVQINTSPTFTGTGFTQEFTVANPLNTETNLTFNNGFAPTEGTTYYVRARVKGEAEVWSNYTTDTYSFTYSSSQTTPEWFQATGAQFGTDILNGVSTHASGGVITNPGGNRIVNGSFESGVNGWTISKPAWYTVASEPYGNTHGANSLNIYNTNPGSTGNFSGDNAGAYQTVDMTGVHTLNIDFGYEASGGSNLNVNFEVYISETSQTSLRVGTKVLDWRPTSTLTTGNPFSVDLRSYGFTGNKLLKIVAYHAISSTDYAERYFYIDDVQLLFSPVGTITSTPIQLESVMGATAYEGITWDQTLNGGNLDLKVQGSANGVSFSDIPGYTNISEAGDGIKSFDLSGMETPPAHIRVIGTLDGEGVHLHNWSASFAGAPEPVYDFTYINDTELWTPNYPGDPGNPSAAEHSIGILEGTATFNTNIVAGTLTVNADANLNVENILKLHGDIINNGLITFKSSNVENTAQFDEFDGVVSGGGEITVERYIPARRAYRFVSSAVSTSGTIHDNWQEGGDNTAGWGTHITGAGGATNGFDPTSTNNPSMFEVAVDGNNTQYWESIPNTNMLTLNAGTPYLMMVRGDRTIDMSTNEPTPTVTVLRATGDLATGDQPFTGPTMDDGQNFFIGNPYQAAVSIADLLNGATNIKPLFYWFYNANLAGDEGRGQYVVVDMDLGGISALESEANGYLQPGQAILVHATGEGAPSVIFKESYKKVNEPLTQTFRSTNGRLAIQLYYEEAYLTGQTPTDGISIKFSENGNNGIDNYDAPKMWNFDENLSTINAEKNYSIESRAYPENEEVIPLSINSYRTTNYVFEAKPTNIPEETAIYLYDNYTDTYTELSSEDVVTYSFEVDASIEASKSSTRFELRFTVNLLGMDDLAMSSVALYPNPLNGDSFQILARGFESESLNVQIVNMLGQVVYSGAVPVASNGVASVNLSTSIASGIYNVKIVSKNNQTINKKLIKK